MSKWQQWKSKFSVRLLALNIVRITCLTLNITSPLFSAAWVAFRFTGYKVANKMDEAAESLETKRSCCTIA
jgi:hypothetical protein